MSEAWHRNPTLKAEYRKALRERRGKAGRMATFRASELRRRKRDARGSNEAMALRAAEPLRVAMVAAERRASEAESRLAEVERSRGERSRGQRSRGSRRPVAMSEQERARRAAAQVQRAFTEGGRDAGHRALVRILAAEFEPEPRCFSDGCRRAAAE